MLLPQGRVVEGARFLKRARAISAVGVSDTSVRVGSSDGSCWMMSAGDLLRCRSLTWTGLEQAHLQMGKLPPAPPLKQPEPDIYARRRWA